MSAKLLVTDSQDPGDLIVKVLEEAGIDAVFGIAGGNIGPIWTALSKRQEKIRTVLVREESLAGVMAEVYGRMTGKPGVLIGQGLWVLGNGLIGTAEARLSSSPMLLLTDVSDAPPFSLHAEHQAGTGLYGSWDARQSFAGITKEVFHINEPVNAVHATQLAIKHALSGQPGPVAVLYGFNALNGKVEPTSQPRLYPTHHYLPPRNSPAVPADVDRAAHAIKAAQRPVIIAGNGVRIAQAYAALQQFAQAAQIPVVTTPSGKGVLPETHPLALGLFGTFGLPAANACVADADLVLVVGSKLSAGDTAKESAELLDPQRQTFVQIDVEPRNASWTFPADHVLVGDAGAVLAQLSDAIGSRPSGAAGEDRVAAYRKAHGYFDGQAYRSPAAPLLPQRIISELRRHLPEDAIVTCDAGENRMFMTHFYQTQREGTFISAAGAGPMGFAIPSALAAKLLHPERAVVAVCGDGGFAMTMNGLMTAIEQDLPIVTVIFNNQALGWSMHTRGSFAARFAEFDHAAIARAMGCDAVNITEPEALGPALDVALASRRPAVIDVATSLDVSYQDIRSPYAGGVARKPIA